MIISHKNRFIFYKPLKVAGSSVEAALIPQCGDADIITGSNIREEREKFGCVERNINLDYLAMGIHSHSSPQRVFRIFNEEWLEYYKFTIVRNPWDLIVSYFWWNSYQSSDTSITPDSSDTLEDLRDKFSRFIESIGVFKSGPRGTEGPVRVIDWLSSVTLEFYRNVDFVMKYENLQLYYEQVCNHLSLKRSVLPILKGNHRKSNIHYSEYYGEIEKIQVKLAFKDIIDNFKYGFK